MVVASCSRSVAKSSSFSLTKQLTTDNGLMTPDRIRNFSIIAHIDHGKSTLADRFLELTGALSQREMSEQVLDDMDLERERGITIKAHAVRLDYQAKDGRKYVLNLIDTPGHVDFSYEVSRSLSACEGALLVVDASQGVEAQTLANTYLAIEHNLELIPVINKIDLPGAEPERAIEEIEHFIGLGTPNALFTSAKTGEGVDEVLESIVRDVPPPKGNANAPLKALIFDSWYDSYRGVIVLFRVIDGEIRPGTKVRFMSAGRDYQVDTLGVNRPRPTPIDKLGAGEVGFLTASIKAVADVQIGDTITETARPTTEPFPGYQEIKPMVFAGLYPVEADSYEDLRGILPLLEEKRGTQKGFEYIASKRVMLTYELPLNEIVLDFYDRLKSVSRGYASLDYNLEGFRESDLVKLDILVAGEPVDALSLILHRETAQTRGRALAEKMKQLIPRQLFEVPIQAAIGNKVIARETVKALGKNVLAKCYGGDITRKRKLLEKQKEGKKRMKKVGRVEIPQEAFLAVLKVNEG